ncbi:MAG: hypothetical protein HKO57_03145, partial [Akkermansiaceae bacterium]|nr:hypothetical protein [Akkermansiaceae bacterium]
MRGNPLIRLVLVILCLAGAGLVVGRIAGPDPPADGAVPAAPGPGGESGPDHGTSVPAYAEIRLSSAATRVVL